MRRAVPGAMLLCRGAPRGVRIQPIMSTRAPVAAIIFYVLAGLWALVAIGLMGLGLLGAVLSAGSKDPFHVGGLMGGSMVVAGLIQLVPAAFLAAMGFMAHDVRRIAENTARCVTVDELAAFQTGAGRSVPARGGPAAFFYFEKGVEHGPVSASELSALIRSGQVNVFQRIETSVGGDRRPFEMADLEG